MKKISVLDQWPPKDFSNRASVRQRHSALWWRRSHAAPAGTESAAARLRSRVTPALPTVGMWPRNRTPPYTQHSSQIQQKRQNPGPGEVRRQSGGVWGSMWKLLPKPRLELKRCGCFSVASELMCVYENGNCGNFIQGFVTDHYPVCLLKRPLCLTHTNFSPLNTIVVDKRLFGLLAIFILKKNERYMRAFCHRKREEDWSHSSALDWLLYLFSIRQILCTLRM